MVLLERVLSEGVAEVAEDGVLEADGGLLDDGGASFFTVDG